MFERFTDRARRVVVAAQEQARIRKHNYIGTEHILLGLLEEREGVAAQALAALGITPDTLTESITKLVGDGAVTPTGHIPFTPRAKRVFELSLREALQLGHDHIGTEHLLLGVIREGEGIGCKVMLELGAELTKVRQQVIQVLAKPKTEDSWSITLRHTKWLSPGVMHALSSDYPDRQFIVIVQAK